MTRLVMVILAAALLLCPAPFLAQEAKTEEKVADAPAGSWKVYLPWLKGAGRDPKWIFKFEQKGGKWQGDLVSTAPNWPRPTVEKVTLADGVLKFQLKSTAQVMPIEVKLGKDLKAGKLYGSAMVERSATPIELERTTSASLDPGDLMREQFAKQVLGHEAIPIALNLLQNSEKLKAKDNEVRAWADKAIRSADLYGPGVQRDVLLMVAQSLAEEKGYEKFMLSYAQRADRLLDPKEPPYAQKKVLDVLAAALERAGDKPKELATVQQRLAKLDFRVKVKPFAGRKAKSDRVVLVELFTGAQCPPCVAADLAFDAIGKTYKPSEVVLVQYHIHVPAPDPLTCPDSELRYDYYDRAIRGAPATLFNGQPAAAGGGSREDAPEKYEEYVEAIDPLLEEPAKGAIKLTATRKGDKVSVTAEVSKLAQTGDDVRLRLLLVEEEVLYKGNNGIGAHRHVVRSMPGGPDGEVMKAAAGKKTYEIDLAEVKKKQNDYLEKFGERAKFPSKEKPVDLKKLKVIAFVQNDRGAEVLQAAQANVPD